MPDPIETLEALVEEGCLSDLQLECAALDEVAEEDRLMVEEHLGSCLRCRRELETKKQPIGALVANADSIRHGLIERTRVGSEDGALEPSQRVVSGTRRWMAAPLALAAAALLAVAFWPRPRTRPSQEFRARGSTSRESEDAIQIFVSDPSARDPVPLAGGIRKGQGLAFAYVHPEASPARFLAVVGRDAGGRVHWFHPAFEAGSHPRSLPLRSGADIELPDAIIMQAPATGTLEVCGLFTREPLDVASIDRELERGGGWPEGARCQAVEVRP